MSLQASTLRITLVSARDNGWLTTNFETAGGSRAIAQRLAQYIERISTGNESAYSAGNPPSIVMNIKGNAVRASATLTCVSVIATDTVVINGVTFTAVDSGASTNQFVRASSNTTTATNLAAAINASATALVSGYVTATSSLGVVTVFSTDYGIYGNQVTLTTSGGTITASSTRLVSGAVDATAQTLNF